MADQEDQENRGFKVHDRRRFSESGETKPGNEAAPDESGETKPGDEAAPHESATDQPAAAPGGAERPFPEADAEAAEAAAHAAAHQHGEHHAPEINFPTFVISLSTQALAHLGEIPDPVAGAIQVDLGAARQLIDILGMLKDKTAGNLDGDEATLLEHALFDLRMKYVERAQKG